MIDFKRLITPSFIFNSQPQGFHFFKTSVIILAVMIGLGIAIYFVWRTDRFAYLQKIKSGIFNMLIWLGIVGLILVFFRWQEIPYLSMPVLFEALIITFTIWSIIILKYILFNFRKEKENFRQKQQFEKYLPASRLRSRR